MSSQTVMKPGQIIKKKHLSIVAKLVKENNGKLPTAKWLEKNGYKATYAYVLRHPEYFRDLKRQRLIPPVEEYVELAEALAEENNGKLPTATWLDRNGYNSLYAYMRDHTKHFEHIRREYKISLTDKPVRPIRKYKRVRDHLKTARRLVKEHGFLPGCQWLMQNGHTDLYACINNHPEAFRNIEKKKTVSMVEQNEVETIGKVTTPGRIRSFFRGITKVFIRRNFYG